MVCVEEFTVTVLTSFCVPLSMCSFAVALAVPIPTDPLLVAKFAPVVLLRVVNAPVDAVPDPMAPGAANVAPLSELALRLATLVVEATTNGAVPVETVLVIWPVADNVVNAPVLTPPEPMLVLLMPPANDDAPLL